MTLTFLPNHKCISLEPTRKTTVNYHRAPQKPNNYQRKNIDNYESLRTYNHACCNCKTTVNCHCHRAQQKPNNYQRKNIDNYESLRTYNHAYCVLPDRVLATAHQQKTSARWQLTTSTHYCGAIHRTEHHRHPRESVLSADHHLLATTWARLASSTLSNVKITRRTPLAAVFPSQRQWQLTPLVPWPSKWRDESAKLPTSHCPTLG